MNFEFTKITRLFEALDEDDRIEFTVWLADNSDYEHKMHELIQTSQAGREIVGLRDEICELVKSGLTEWRARRDNQVVFGKLLSLELAKEKNIH